MVPAGGGGDGGGGGGGAYVTLTCRTVQGRGKPPPRVCSMSSRGGLTNADSIPCKRCACCVWRLLSLQGTAHIHWGNAPMSYRKAKHNVIA